MPVLLLQILCIWIEIGDCSYRQNIVLYLKNREEAVKLAGGMFDPKKRKKITAVIAIILALAMVIPTVLSLVIR